MRSRTILRMLATSAVVTAAVVAAILTRESWMAWFQASAQHDDEQPIQASTANENLKLTEQAQRNLRLVSKPLAPTTYWRTIQVPGTVVERPGQNDREVASPVAGIVTKIHRLPGETVRPGEVLFTVRLVGESVGTVQSELQRTMLDIQNTEAEKKRLSKAFMEGAIAGARLIELDNQLRRLKATAEAQRVELKNRGLSPAQIESAAKGQFASEIQISAPDQATAAAMNDEKKEPVLEIRELKIDPGQQVQLGQTLCLLSNRQSLFIEGRAFRSETALIDRAMKGEWAVEVEFLDDGEDTWPTLKQTFHIHTIGNTIDPVSRTFAFLLPLANQSRSVEKAARTFLVWRFRPGQKVRLQVPVEKFDDVLVLPADAVAREGPETYVFRQNGDLFQRKSVHILHEDRRNVVIANDGVVRPGIDYLAQSAGASLNRILKAQNASGGLPPGAHFHADGSLHIPGK